LAENKIIISTYRFIRVREYLVQIESDDSFNVDSIILFNLASEPKKILKV